jgi:hypothetical protein
MYLSVISDMKYRINQKNVFNFLYSIDSKKKSSGVINL